MKIKVDKIDIENGVKQNPRLCPIANAIYKIPNSCRIYVGLRYASYYRVDDGIMVQGELPEDVQEKVKNYDKTGKMEPFEFEIEFL